MVLPPGHARQLPFERAVVAVAGHELLEREPLPRHVPEVVDDGRFLVGALPAHQGAMVDPGPAGEQRELLVDHLDAAGDGDRLQGEVSGEAVDGRLELRPGPGQVERRRAGDLGRPPRPGLGPGSADQRWDAQEHRWELHRDDRVTPFRRPAHEALGDESEHLPAERLARRAGHEVAHLAHEVHPQRHPPVEHVENPVLRPFRPRHLPFRDGTHGVERDPPPDQRLELASVDLDAPAERRDRARHRLRQVDRAPRRRRRGGAVDRVRRGHNHGRPW